MRPSILLLALGLASGLALGAPALSAADANEARAQFDEAFNKGEASDKKEALRIAQSLGKDQDDLAFELLIKGVNDRQVHDEAVMALRARTGLQPTLLNRGSGYPGYPASDDASEWNNWLASRKKDKETQKKIAEQDKKLKDIEDADKDGKGKDGKGKGKDGKGKDGEGTDGEKPTAEKPATGDGEKPADPATASGDGEKPAQPAYEPPSDLGRLDRIVFKTGGSLVCYVLSKRVNADGVLQSVRIVHQNNGGEEILSADLIARIDEDVR